MKAILPLIYYHYVWGTFFWEVYAGYISAVPCRYYVAFSFFLLLFYNLIDLKEIKLLIAFYFILQFGVKCLNIKLIFFLHINLSSWKKRKHDGIETYWQQLTEFLTTPLIRARQVMLANIYLPISLIWRPSHFEKCITSFKVWFVFEHNNLVL